MDKNAIKSFAVWARKKLIADTTYRASIFGITKEKIADPQMPTPDIQRFEYAPGLFHQISGKEIQQRESLIRRIEEVGFDQVIEEVAYTWFNRIIALRFMEVRDYLTPRILSSEQSGKFEPDLVTEAPDVESVSLTPADVDEVLALKLENRFDDLFRFLFIKQCNSLNASLPGLFQKTEDYSELLLTVSYTNPDGVVRRLISDISEDDFRDSVEIIGWLYQYYNSELKDDTFARLKKNQKITKERIPSATQLFTPEWIVRYMVENSLGRLWLNGHPSESLKENWKYYLDEAEQDAEVEEQLAVIRQEHKKLRPQDIKVIDPCMGSGHILVYAFDVLMQIYEKAGYSPRDAAESILTNNLYGLDIDDRASQLAYFAVMMKAREYNRRIFNAGIRPNLWSIAESNIIPEDLLIQVSAGDAEVLADLQYLTNVFTDAKEYGSILQVKPLDYARLREAVTRLSTNSQQTIFSFNEELTRLQQIVEQADLLSRQYDVVVTNPPYMGGGGMNPKLSEFVKKLYPNTKSDMSTVCMERTLDMCNSYGYMSMINIPVWMFISSYKKLRESLITDNTIINLVHPGRGIFGSDFGTTTFVILKQHIKNYSGHYRRLFEKQGEVESIECREQRFFEGKKIFISSQNCFSKIPGSPIVYWVGDNFRNAYSIGKLIGDLGSVSEGIKTGDNDRFLRFWYEIPADVFSFAKSNNGYKWYPYHKGGDYRKWFGNNIWAINWEHNGTEIKSQENSGIQGKTMLFQEFSGWSKISSKGNPLRYYSKNILFDSMAPAFSCNGNTKYITGLLNSIVGVTYLGMLNPTVASQVGDIKNVPVIFNHQQTVNGIVNCCLTCSERDWDSFETSWDFVQHPFLTYKGETVQASFENWEKHAEEQFNQLKANEEELNRIFIEIYGMQDELTPEVEDKDVTVRKADLKRDVKSFLSYAVGCMLGRYSLDTPGLAYAGGEWDASKYQTFIPDVDGILPITDDEYFEDDIVARLITFLKVIYGEKTLEENLTFIADALGTKGSTARAVIRNYFLKDFYADHLQIYQNRPIYWMFDSGKENGFKALIYLHRYDRDTVGRVRTDYLHKTQKALEAAMSRADYVVKSDIGSASEKKKAAEALMKLNKQLAETRRYELAIALIAHQRIDLDLDDGVKVNYAKFQDVVVAEEGKMKQTINLLG